MPEPEKKKTQNVGGQAVIEGVMIRSPYKVTVAVRRNNGKILIKSENYESFVKKNKLLKLPFIRGGIVLIETLYLGVKNLSWSSKIAMEDENNNDSNKKTPEYVSGITTWLSVIFGLSSGLLLFFYLPLLLTDLTGLKSGFSYNLVDSLIRIILFILYVFLISKWKEVQRVFQYHGAEHKSIYAYENGHELTLENAEKYGTQHPRCGTSFIVGVIVIGFFIFLFLGRPENISEKMIRFLFIPVIGGLAYEFIKISDKYKNNILIKAIIKPGLWFQKITTKEPDKSQLKVGLVALRSSLGENIDNDPEVTYFH